MTHTTPPNDAQMDDGPLTVLVVDDEERLVRSCARILEGEGYGVYTASRMEEALALLRKHAPDIVLTDLRLPDGDGMEVLRAARGADPDVVVVMITAFATVDSSIEAIREGAYDYLPKPFTATQLQVLLGRASRQIRLARDNARLRAQLRERDSLDNVVGTSAPMRQLAELVQRVAPTDASVFLTGASGSGKELIARALHRHSGRREGPFVAVNCAAFPEHLLESELFGHEKGAFTGAETTKRGLMELASGGTFFLDEVCDMSLELQAKLLRALEERRIRRVGGEQEIRVDIRVLAATNRDPDAAIEAGALRQDLYYRLNVVPMRVPSLRERREDIPLLAEHFLREYAARYDRDGSAGLRLTAEALEALERYDWPGNVRELRNVMERVVSLAEPGGRIVRSDLPPEVRGAEVEEGPAHRTDLPFHEAKSRAIERFERAYLRSLLAGTGGNISAAARAADMDRKTIHRLLDKHGLDAQDLAGG